MHQIDVIKKGMEAFHNYLSRKVNEIEEAEKLLDQSRAKGKMNHRQLALLKHALKSPNAIYSIQEDQTSHAISYPVCQPESIHFLSGIMYISG